MEALHQEVNFKSFVRLVCISSCEYNSHVSKSRQSKSMICIDCIL